MSAQAHRTLVPPPPPTTHVPGGRHRVGSMTTAAWAPRSSRPRPTQILPHKGSCPRPRPQLAAFPRTKPAGYARGGRSPCRRIRPGSPTMRSHARAGSRAERQGRAEGQGGLTHGEAGQRDAHAGLGGDEAGEDEFDGEEGEREHCACPGAGAGAGVAGSWGRGRGWRAQHWRGRT